MADKTPVHVLSRKDGWAVVREGKERATSVHPTQAEAAKAGREVARKEGSVFLLHAKDGRVRDRSDYGAGSGPLTKRAGGPAASVAGVAGAATQATGGAASLASEVVGGAIGVGQDSGETSNEKGTDDERKAGGLAYEERYADYEVYDRDGERLGHVDALFIDEDDRPEYLGVKMGLLGTRSTLLPWATVARADEEGGRLEVDVDKETAEEGPAFEDDQEITPELERRVHVHYTLEQAGSAGNRGAYGDYRSGADQTSTTTDTTAPDTASPISETGGPETDASREHEREGRNLREPGTDAEDEIRVQRSEEELVAGTTRREAGTLRVRKRVRTDRERVEVPVRREEVNVERVPVSGEKAEADIGEDEVVVPVTEDEVVVSKRAVVKEEIRIRKDVVESTEVVEEDVRREEIDVVDETEQRNV